MQEQNKHTIQDLKISTDRVFGFVFAGIFLFVALFPLLHGHSIRLWALGFSLAFGTIALIAHKTLAPLNRHWARFGLLLHRIVSPVILAILFYFVVTPTALIMRLIGKIPLQLDFDRSAVSYWIERRPSGQDADTFKRQF